MPAIGARPSAVCAHCGHAPDARNCVAARLAGAADTAAHDTAMPPATRRRRRPRARRRVRCCGPRWWRCCWWRRRCWSLLTVQLRGGPRAGRVRGPSPPSAAGEVRRDLLRTLQDLQALQALRARGATQPGRPRRAALLRERRELRRIERRDARCASSRGRRHAVPRPRCSRSSRAADIEAEADVACAAARRGAAPTFSRSYFVPLRRRPRARGDRPVPAGAGTRRDDRLPGRHLRAGGAARRRRCRRSSIAQPRAVVRRSRRHAAGARRRGARRRRLRAQQLVDLPGNTLLLRVDSAAGAAEPDPQPAHRAGARPVDRAVRRWCCCWRATCAGALRAEQRLAEALAFRKAMEDSLVTGLRARDLQGRITYVNPAFCEMVGFSADELLRPRAAPPPYWPPELRRANTSSARPAPRPAGRARRPREGFESVFMRKDGERFPVLIYRGAADRRRTGAQTGWMSAVLDISEQRRVEELSRASQERLQATARLATVGEMASLLSHELNQPLAAIASYATGSLNLLRCRPPARGHRADAAPGAAAHRRAGRARRPGDQERARLRAPPRPGARAGRGRGADRRGAAAGAPAGAQAAACASRSTCPTPACRACCATARWSSRCC